MTRVSPNFFAVAILVGLTLGSAVVRAAPPQGTLNRSISTSGPIAAPPAGAPPRNWSRETEATCGMACRYHHANDNLTMQALYLVTKISKIQTAITADPKSTEARTTLGAFCTDGAEDVGDCFKRYKDFQNIALLDIRQAIGKNEDSIARLTTGRKADGTVAEETAISYESGEEEHPYVPDVPTLSDLEDSYLKGKLKPSGGQSYSRAEIQKWSLSLIVNDPKTRYIQFSKTPAVGNPYQEEKSSYSVYMEQRDEAGNSAGADERALGIYNKSEKRVKEFAKDTKIDGKIKIIEPSNKLEVDDKITYDAFVQARSVINSKIQTDEQRHDQEAKDRKLASQKTPDPKPSPGASSSPKSFDNDNARSDRDVKVTTGGLGAQKPKEYHTFGPDENVDPPKEMKNSRYIKYDLGDLLNDTEQNQK
jgi:hypothetical protein